MLLRRFAAAFVGLLLSLPCFCQPPAASASSLEAAHRAELGIQALQHWYVERTGLYRTTGWWNSANAITVLTDFMRASGSKHYLPVLANTFTRAQVVVPKPDQTGVLHGMTGKPGFLNTYYDDEGWWALAWIDAYDLTGKTRYLAMGKSIFADMSGGWDQTCGGGIWWSKDRTYKNAIANELFFSVAAHLASRAGTSAERQHYADWAQKEWHWFQNSGMINKDSLVNDGLSIDPRAGACRNNGRTVWTYNQGVLLGALTEWSRTEHNPDLVVQARRLADAALVHMTDDKGVLHDKCEPNCGGDGIQFKGIFVRNLRALQQDVHDSRYLTFFKVNAESLWTRDQGPGHTFGVDWAGPYASPGAGAQGSALDALVTEAAQK